MSKIKKFAEKLIENSNSVNNMKKEKTIVFKLTVDDYNKLDEYSSKLNMTKQNIIELSLRESGFI